MAIWLPSKNQAKNPFHAESYRPVILLPVCRKLLSKIFLQRIRPVPDNEVSSSQYAYMTRKLTGGVVLAYKYSISGAKVKGMVKSCVGTDLSKAFDTANTYKTLEILKKRNWAGKNMKYV